MSLTKGNNKTVFLSRKQHDALFDRDHGLLELLFKQCVRRWSLGGVTFYNVHPNTAMEVHLQCGDVA